MYGGQTKDDYWFDNYLRIWSRYHVYGLGILFGWLIIELKNGHKFGKFLKSTKGAVLLWYVSLALLWITGKRLNSNLRLRSRNLYSQPLFKFTLCLCISLWTEMTRILWALKTQMTYFSPFQGLVQPLYPLQYGMLFLVKGWLELPYCNPVFRF